MAQKRVVREVKGKQAVDGAGVRLVRVIGHADTADFDPFLMLDSFDSTDPDDYVRGFPYHPHRGIETVTYLIEGLIEHRDSLGNADAIRAGESQWMTAGSGIMHEEMPKPAPRMLGLQLWLNMPAAQKMEKPAYLAVTADLMGGTTCGDALVRVMSGSFNGASGVNPPHVPATILDFELKSGGSAEIPCAAGETVFIFLIEGGLEVAGQAYTEKSALLLGEGNAVSVEAAADAPSRFLLFSAPPLKESIAWGGPIVMNTREELMRAFAELDEGTFIKHKIKI